MHMMYTSDNMQPLLLLLLAVVASTATADSSSPSSNSELCATPDGLLLKSKADAYASSLIAAGVATVLCMATILLSGVLANILETSVQNALCGACRSRGKLATSKIDVALEPVIIHGQTPAAAAARAAAGRAWGPLLAACALQFYAFLFALAGPVLPWVTVSVSSGYGLLSLASATVATGLTIEIESCTGSAIDEPATCTSSSINNNDGLLGSALVFIGALLMLISYIVCGLLAARLRSLYYIGRYEGQGSVGGDDAETDTDSASSSGDAGASDAENEFAGVTPLAKHPNGGHSTSKRAGAGFKPSMLLIASVPSATFASIAGMCIVMLGTLIMGVGPTTASASSAAPGGVVLAFAILMSLTAVCCNLHALKITRGIVPALGADASNICFPMRGSFGNDTARTSGGDNDVAVSIITSPLHDIKHKQSSQMSMVAVDGAYSGVDKQQLVGESVDDGGHTKVQILSGVAAGVGEAEAENPSALVSVNPLHDMRAHGLGAIVDIASASTSFSDSTSANPTMHFLSSSSSSAASSSVFSTADSRLDTLRVDFAPTLAMHSVSLAASNSSAHQTNAVIDGEQVVRNPLSAARTSNASDAPPMTFPNPLRAAALAAPAPSTPDGEDEASSAATKVQPPPPQASPAPAVIPSIAALKFQSSPDLAAITIQRAYKGHAVRSFVKPWYKVTDDDGDTFFKRRDTGEMAWTMPDSIPFEFHPVSSKPAASATTAAVGKTSQRAGDKGEDDEGWYQIGADGVTKHYLDSDDDSGRMLLPGWARRSDGEDVWYKQLDTGTTQWDPPLLDPPASHEDDGGYGTSDNDDDVDDDDDGDDVEKDASGVVWHLDGPNGKRLAQGWKRCEDDTDVWYKHMKTGMTQWEPPYADQGGDDDDAGSDNDGSDGGGEEDGANEYIEFDKDGTKWYLDGHKGRRLAKDWKRVEDADGDVWYKNIKTGKTQWSPLYADGKDDDDDDESDGGHARKASGGSKKASAAASNATKAKASSSDDDAKDAGDEENVEYDEDGNKYHLDGPGGLRLALGWIRVDDGEDVWYEEIETGNTQWDPVYADE